MAKILTDPFKKPLASAIKCLSCHSSQPGCGKDVNIRFQRWSSCQSTGKGGGENFCVKVLEKRDGEEYITRDCLMNLRLDTRHRLRMPTIQRHGYCEYARNDDPWMPLDKSVIYCFCNDYNACNSAPKIVSYSIKSALFAIVFLKLIAF